MNSGPIVLLTERPGRHVQCWIRNNQNGDDQHPEQQQRNLCQSSHKCTYYGVLHVRTFRDPPCQRCKRRSSIIFGRLSSPSVKSKSTRKEKSLLPWPLRTRRNSFRITPCLWLS